jgi:uncharacterized surface protein with fasciclin (FAS1) repeats
VKTKVLFAALLAMTLGFGIVQAQQSTLPKPSETILEIINKGKHFTKLAAALKLTGLDKILAGKGLYTLFAPSNAAFEKIPKATLDKLLTDKVVLTKILLYHLAAGKLGTAELLKMGSVKTAEGASLKFSNLKNIIRVNRSRMAAKGVDASNGEIHVIGLLLVPPLK